MGYYEYKYLVSNDQLSYLQQLLRTLYANSDSFQNGIVDSIYFDNVTRNCYADCANGEPVKEKFRVRGYGNGYFSSVHYKRKDLFQVSKYKSQVKPLKAQSSLPQWADLVDAKGSDLQFQNINQLADQYGRLIPAVRIRYSRERFRIYDYRITLDYNITASSCDFAYGTKLSETILPCHVLEIKTSKERPVLPTLGLIDLKPTSFSKFYQGVQMLDGESL
jgi:hypothetical protein